MGIENGQQQSVLTTDDVWFFVITTKIIYLIGTSFQDLQG